MMRLTMVIAMAALVGAGCAGNRSKGSTTTSFADPRMESKAEASDRRTIGPDPTESSPSTRDLTPPGRVTNVPPAVVK